MSKKEFRNVTVTAQFYDSKTRAMTPVQKIEIQAPFYQKARKEHPEYRMAIKKAIESLASMAGVPSGSIPSTHSII
jgi:hypothetical protein